MIIQTQGLWKYYRGEPALRNVGLSVPEGSAFALIGANAAGKTTLIKILLNLIDPSRGRAQVAGVDSCALSPVDFRQLGYVADRSSLPPAQRVGRYLNYLRPFYPTWDPGLERQLIESLRLPLDKRIAELSHGTRMKLALACALCFRPKLLVLDEPFQGLDALTRDELVEGLLSQAGEMTVLLSSHELADIESFVTHIGFLDNGRLLLQESAEALHGRMREVRVTLLHEVGQIDDLPKEWLQVRAVGRVLHFVDSQFSASGLQDRLSGLLGEVKGIDVQPLSLRALFTALARSARAKGAVK